MCVLHANLILSVCFDKKVVLVMQLDIDLYNSHINQR